MTLMSILYENKNTQTILLWYLDIDLKDNQFPKATPSHSNPKSSQNIIFRLALAWLPQSWGTQCNVIFKRLQNSSGHHCKHQFPLLLWMPEFLPQSFLPLFLWLKTWGQDTRHKCSVSMGKSQNVIATTSAVQMKNCWLTKLLSKTLRRVTLKK